MEMSFFVQCETLPEGLGESPNPYPQTYLEREFTSDRFVIANTVAGMALVGRLFGGEAHVAIVVLVHRVQYPIGPGRSSSIQ